MNPANCDPIGNIVKNTTSDKSITMKAGHDMKDHMITGRYSKCSLSSCTFCQVNVRGVPVRSVAPDERLKAVLLSNNLSRRNASVIQ